MQVERLTLRNFRNLKPLDLWLQAPSVLLVGDNAQGKTNLLEALHLCVTGRSFRTPAAAELIGPDGPQAHANAVFSQRGVRHEVRIVWGPVGAQGQVRQRLWLDGRLMRQTADLLALLNVVAFFPEDLRIAKAGPEARRRFFDRAIAGGRPAFVAASLAYQRALKARNAALRHPSFTPAMVAAYDDALARHGAAIHVARRDGLAELLPLAQQTFSQLMPASRLAAQLHSGFTARPGEPILALNAGVDAVAAYFRALWQRSLTADRARGMTLRGPHRADLLCAIDDRDARAFASQGQQRCLVLALKLAELTALTRRLGHAPVLLLDDVSSELDAGRLARLFHWVAHAGAQVWISSTGSVALPAEGPQQRLCIDAGQVR